ncbi:MAG: hypothetical protein KBS85_00175 [Lachnospiraceae bacterium]|nr:hypothetical protein [Candidatus Merdinaster equi]
MDIKAKIDEIVKKFQTDENFKNEFGKNPVKAVEGVLGIDLPDDQINGIIDGVKAKVSLDKLGGLFGGFGK